MSHNLSIPGSADRHIDLALGRIDGHFAEYKFGFQAAIGTTSQTVWDNTTVYTYLAAPSKVTLSSSSASDIIGGAGASSIEILGLDQNFLLQSEFMHPNGQTGTTSKYTYSRIYRTINRSVNTAVGDIHVGTGTITAGVPATKLATILAGNNQTLMALYTCPADKIMVLHELTLSTALKTNQEVTCRLMIRPPGQSFQTRDVFVLTQGAVLLTYVVPRVFSGRTDIQIRAATSSGTQPVSAAFSLELINN